MSVKTTIHILLLSLGLSTTMTATALAQAAGSAATASPAPSAVPGKIAIVNMQEAIANTNEGKKEVDELQKKFSPKQAELKNLSDEVENLKKRLQTQVSKLSDEERSNRLRVMVDKQKALQRNFEDATNEFQQAEQELLNRLGQKMLTVLDKYAKEQGYSVVLDVSNPQTPVLWANQDIIITKDLVEAYNKEVPMPGATSAPAKPAGGAATATHSARPSAPTPHTPAATTPK